MAEQQDVISLPVVLSEGSERVHVGTVSVHPSVSFSALQSEMSGMIGVPPYQMTAFLERPSRNYRIIPVNEKVLDLAAVAREGAGEWRLLAVVRRPRNGRSRRGRRSKGSSRLPEDHRKPSQIQPEKIILRRNADAGNANASTVYDLMYGPVGVTPVWGPLYSHPQVQEIRSVDRTERAAEAEEKEDGVWQWRDAWRAAEPAKAVCAVCDAAAKETDSAKAFQFHCCVRDEILTLTVGSVGRSPVGPIERPSRRRVQNLGFAA